MSRTRVGVDQFSEYVEEETGRGWRKLRRKLNGYEFLVYGSKTDDYINAINAAGVHLRLNDMSDRIELKDGRPITKIQEADIESAAGLRHEGYGQDARRYQRGGAQE